MAERFISEGTATGELIIFDTITKNTHVLNLTAALIYKLYKDNHTFDEIVDTLKEKYPNSPEKDEIKGDVEEILNDLKLQKVVS